MINKVEKKELLPVEVNKGSLQNTISISLK